MKKWNQIYEWSKRVSLYWGKDSGDSSVEEEHPVVRRVVKRLSDLEYLQQKGREQGRFNADAAFEKLHRRNQRRILVRVGSVAAIFLLFVGAIMMYTSNLSPEKDSLTLVEKTNSSFQPGSNKAILELADGREFLLDDTLRTKIETAAGVVEIDSAGVVYAMGNDSLLGERQQEFHTMRIPRGGEFHLVLSDGTQVWLNSETELRFPVHFSDSKREIYLKGEAYFDVVSDAKRPFIVGTSMGAIKVLGTAFNVSIYNEKSIAATLERGAISYQSEGGKELLIKPGEQLIYDDNMVTPVIRKVNTRLYTAWKDNLFCFEEQCLEEIMTTLARWYDFQVEFESEELKHVELSGTLEKYSDIQSLLKLFELSTNVKFEIRDKNIYVRKVK